MHGSEKRDVKGVKNVKLLIDSVRGGKRHAREKATEKSEQKREGQKIYQIRWPESDRQELNGKGTQMRGVER
jgi:hypothetical protein